MPDVAAEQNTYCSNYLLIVVSLKAHLSVRDGTLKNIILSIKKYRQNLIFVQKRGTTNSNEIKRGKDVLNKKKHRTDEDDRRTRIKGLVIPDQNFFDITFRQ